MTQVAVLVPAAVLGTGVNPEDVANGVRLGAVAIAVDAGSTDSGPAYLATARSKMAREAIKRDLAVLMQARAAANIPLLVGSCGTSGADAAVDWTANIVAEIADELGQSVRVARLYSEVAPSVLKTKLEEGRVRPLPPMGPLQPETIERCDHIVALMGFEPYARAMEAGADIVLGGRTTDTAVLAAPALMRGLSPGPAWHAAKIAECGGLCTVDPTGGGVLITMDETGFVVEPLRAGNRCTPYSVSAHMLYENADPFRLTEPGGVLDVSRSAYAALDERRVRVEGSVFEPAPYTMKLEGAGGGPFQTIMLIGVRDPKVIASLDLWKARLATYLEGRIAAAFGEEAGDYSISLRAYGWDAVTGSPPPEAVIPHEVGVLFVASARSQDLATRIAKLCNPFFFHFPLSAGEELPSYGFPFSPAEIERGQAYAFHLNHVVETADPFELVRMTIDDLSPGERA